MIRKKLAVAGVCVSGALLLATNASAQQRTFHLDRLEMPGAPEDGAVLFRPVTQAKTIVFGQYALGFSLRPLRTATITTDRATLRNSSSGVVDYQLTQYATAGIQFLDRITLAATLPVTWLQGGQNPSYPPGSVLGGPSTTTVQTDGPGAGDVRLDLRGVIARSDDRKAAFGAQLGLFLPTGTVSNFGGNGQATTMVAISGEYTWRFITFVGNMGVQFRPKSSINNPRTGQGLGIGNEWRWAAGAFIPLKDGKYRIGGTIFGQTGIEGDENIIGSTFFTKRNTPIEWNVEGRMKFGPADAWWVGASGGSFILKDGYGAPDFRIFGLIGASMPILDSDPKSPESKAVQRARWKAQHAADSDHDGIPDDVDACVNEPEDKLGADPSDGCPLPPDKDGDGIPDQWDKCPDVAEDKDGIDDGDGCREDDFDQDGVADVQDACPRAPGKPSPNPKQNGCPQSFEFDGKIIRIKQQVHFKTGSAEILPDSFPMLQEIADLMKANQSIKRISIEGHTDNKGNADMNLKLSQARSDSVMAWLTQHGVESNRLEAHGYGVTRPIETNATAEGRAANRRVEFRISEEVDMNKPATPPPGPKPQQPKPAEGEHIELD